MQNGVQYVLGVGVTSHTKKKACYSCKTYPKVTALVTALRVALERRKARQLSMGLNKIKKVTSQTKRLAERTFDFDLSPDFKDERKRKADPRRKFGALSMANPLMQNFLGKVDAHVICLMEQIFRQYRQIFEKEFKQYFRSKAGVFSKYLKDLEKQIRFNISSTMKNFALLKQFLTPTEIFRGNKSTSVNDRKDLLSQNFSSVLSGGKQEQDPLNLVLDFTKSHIENLKKGYDFQEIGKFLY